MHSEVVLLGDFHPCIRMLAQSFSKRREAPVAAKWEGNELIRGWQSGKQRRPSVPFLHSFLEGTEHLEGEVDLVQAVFAQVIARVPNSLFGLAHRLARPLLFRTIHQLFLGFQTHRFTETPVDLLVFLGLPRHCLHKLLQRSLLTVAVAVAVVEVENVILEEEQL